MATDSDTRRLYHDDPTLVAFRARILDQEPADGGVWITLDRTAFYPGGGGQPADAGRLDGRPVLDLAERAGVVHHLVPRTPSGPRVRGEVDWSRRFDHMQQHTAQHLLSRVLWRSYGARTIGFHIGASVSNVDLDRLEWSDEEWAAVEERLARHIREARAIRTRVITRDQALQLDIRRMPDGHERLRVVTISGLDDTPCGGTHVRSTHEIESIKLVGTEKLGSRLRLFYLAGARVRRDHHRLRELARRLALSASVGVDDLEGSWTTLRASELALRRSLRARTAELLGLRLDRWLAEADLSGPVSPPGGRARVRIVVRRLDAQEGDEISTLTDRLASVTRVVLIVGWAGAEKATVVLARTSDVDIDLRAIASAAAALLGGGGGGRPERAQGGGPRLDALDDALRDAAERAGRALA